MDKVRLTEHREKRAAFKRTLSRYVNYRGIDIILYLKDGSVVELDKNRKLDGNIVIKNNKKGDVTRINLSKIQKAEFYSI
jgi:hypothetical protein